jgi:NADPH:quinone reductase-like Zn-dependent oxidoreductase
LGKGGRLVWLGTAAIEKQGLRVGLLSMPMTSLFRLIPDSKRAPRCPTVDKFAKKNKQWYRETLTELLDWLAAGRIKPVVAERIPLAEAARAHQLLERGGHAGKVVLVTSA